MISDASKFMRDLFDGLMIIKRRRRTDAPRALAGRNGRSGNSSKRRAISGNGAASPQRRNAKIPNGITRSFGNKLCDN